MAPAIVGVPRRRPAAAQAAAAVAAKAPSRPSAGSWCADMDECPTAAKATHTTAKSAARRARSGDRASVIARNGAIPPSGRTDPPPVLRRTLARTVAFLPRRNPPGAESPGPGPRLRGTLRS
ncbi:hypothetical protein BN2537_12607 [Streptomyces venezuelae]|nr:hypothetical protein BN2537_12607 [Streptomyces venezuelae]